MAYCKAIRKIYAPLSVGGETLEDVLATALRARYRLACFNGRVWAFDCNARWVRTELVIEDLRCDSK